MLILSGCGTNRPVVLPPTEEPPRDKPIEAMANCEDALSALPDNFPDLTVKEALELLEVNHIIDSTFYFECKRKQEDLTRWIQDE